MHSKTFEIEHINSHQDNIQSCKSINVKVRLNIDADKITTTTAKKPINTHLITQHYAVYIKGKYKHQKIDQDIRRQSHYTNAKIFFKKTMVNYKHRNH